MLLVFEEEDIVLLLLLLLLILMLGVGVEVDVSKQHSCHVLVASTTYKSDVSAAALFSTRVDTPATTSCFAELHHVDGRALLKGVSGHR